MKIVCPYCRCEEETSPGLLRRTYSCLGCGKSVTVPGAECLGLRVTAAVLVALGVIVTAVGVFTPTSVRSPGGPEVVNLGLLFARLTAIVGGLLLVGLGVMVRILAALQSPTRLR